MLSRIVELGVRRGTLWDGLPLKFLLVGESIGAKHPQRLQFWNCLLLLANIGEDD
jgi:hypothetical protein